MVYPVANLNSPLVNTSKSAEKNSFFSYSIHAIASLWPVQKFTKLCITIITSLGVVLKTGIEQTLAFKDRIFSENSKKADSNTIKTEEVKPNLPTNLNLFDFQENEDIFDEIEDNEDSENLPLIDPKLDLNSEESVENNLISALPRPVSINTSPNPVLQKSVSSSLLNKLFNIRRNLQDSPIVDPSPSPSTEVLSNSPINSNSNFSPNVNVSITPKTKSLRTTLCGLIQAGVSLKTSDPSTPKADVPSDETADPFFNLITSKNIATPSPKKGTTPPTSASEWDSPLKN